MSDKQVRDYDKFMLRFPDGMREAIAERAKANGRSMNSEIVNIIQDVIDGKLNSCEQDHMDELTRLATDYRNSLSKLERIMNEKKTAN